MGVSSRAAIVTVDDDALKRQRIAGRRKSKLITSMRVACCEARHDDVATVTS